MTAPHGVPDRVIVVGASSGGIEALMRLAAALPRTLAAPVCIVQHIGEHTSTLPWLLRTAGPLAAVHAQSGQAVRAGMLYVAPPDLHMLLVDHALRLSHGAKENHARPAIDPLFRTAADVFGPRAIGVILTGRLDDGAAGLKAIKACGGTAIVQDPADAQCPDMPRSALRATPVDHCVPLERIAPLLAELAAGELPAATAPPHPALHSEVQINLGADSMAHLPQIARPSGITCPDCGGALWEMNGEYPPRWRCHTGHAFSENSLAHVQAETAEEALWASLRVQREKAMLLQRVAELADAAGDTAQAIAARRLAAQVLEQAERLHRLTQAREPD